MRRMFLASLLGGLFSLLEICVRGKGSICVFISLLELTGMIWFCMPKASIATKGRLLLLIVAEMSILSVVIRFVTKLYGGSEREWMYKGGVLFLFSLALAVREWINKPRTTVFQVLLCVNGRKIRTHALLDTGNSLRDPNTGKMVSIVEKRVVDFIVTDEKNEGLRKIPFHSVGEKDGQMTLITSDQISVWVDGEEKKIYGMYLGVYEGILSSTEEFQMILHKDSLKEGKKHECNLPHLFTKTIQYIVRKN